MPNFKRGNEPPVDTDDANANGKIDDRITTTLFGGLTGSFDVLKPAMYQRLTDVVLNSKAPSNLLHPKQPEDVRLPLYQPIAPFP